jgi:hypothetical protein
MNTFFWILWIIEFILTGWWLQSEMKLTYLKPNPFVFITLLYLLATLGIRYGLRLPKISMGMVGIPAIPLAVMLLIVIIAGITGARWN